MPLQLAWTPNYNISFHSGAFLAAPSVTGESLECWQSSRAKSTLAEKALLRRRGTINTSSSSSKDRKNNTANEGLSKLDSTAIYKPVKANRPPLNRQSCSTGKVAFQLTQRLHIFLAATCSSSAPFLLRSYGVVTLPCQAPAAGPAWPPPGPAVAPSAPRSPAPGDSSSSLCCPAGCEDGWTHPSPPERAGKDQTEMITQSLGY